MGLDWTGRDGTGRDCTGLILHHDCSAPFVNLVNEKYSNHVLPNLQDLPAGKENYMFPVRPVMTSGHVINPCLAKVF